VERAARIFYRALTTYVNPNTNFLGARTATSQAALDLYDAATSTMVQSAWAAVGVGPPPTPVIPDAGPPPEPDAGRVTPPVVPDAGAILPEPPVDAGGAISVGGGATLPPVVPPAPSLPAPAGAVNGGCSTGSAEA